MSSLSKAAGPYILNRCDDDQIDRGRDASVASASCRGLALVSSDLAALTQIPRRQLGLRHLLVHGENEPPAAGQHRRAG